MATIIITGKISGKVGDYVFKQVNGKTIVCNKPLAEVKTRSANLELSRQKMFASIRQTFSKMQPIRLMNLSRSGKKTTNKKTNGK